MHHPGWKNWHTAPYATVKGHLSVGVIGINPFNLGDPLFHAQHICTGAFVRLRVCDEMERNKGIKDCFWMFILFASHFSIHLTEP